jgi:tetratricopeptide (TPR) repeat protein
MAIDSARKAVALDRSPRNRSSLGSVLLAAGRTEDAAGVLRQVVAETPHDYDALLNLANACAQLGDYAGAISHYARAFEADPSQTRTIQNLMNMFADVGRWLGALAALELTRTDEAPPAVAVALDVARLHMIRLIADTFPAPDVGASPDEAVVNAVASASARGSAIQLAVARMLVDLGRLDDASRFLDQIERRPLEAADRAVVLFLRGVLARHAQDPAAALALFEQALATDPTRADACVNATQLLLEQGTSTAFAKVAALIDRVPVERRTPELLFNEAACLARLERPEEARALLERVIRITGGAGRIGQVARDALRELAG